MLQATYPHYLHNVHCLLLSINDQQLKLNKAIGNAAVIAVPKSLKNRKQCFGTFSKYQGLALWWCWSNTSPPRQLLHHIYYGGKFAENYTYNSLSAVMALHVSVMRPAKFCASWMLVVALSCSVAHARLSRSTPTASAAFSDKSTP